MKFEILIIEVLEETGYKVKVEDLELVSKFLGSLGLAGCHLTAYYVEVTDSQVCIINIFFMLTSF